MVCWARGMGPSLSWGFSVSLPCSPRSQSLHVSYRAKLMALVKRSYLHGWSHLAASPWVAIQPCVPTVLPGAEAVGCSPSEQGQCLLLSRLYLVTAQAYRHILWYYPI